MDSGPTTSQHSVASRRSGAARHDEGLDTRVLHQGDTLTVQTCNSVYTLHLEDPSWGRAVATGSGDFLNDPAQARLVGATLSGSGSMVKLGWVLIGFKLVLAIPGGELLTSQVLEIWVNDKPVLMASGVH